MHATARDRRKEKCFTLELLVLSTPEKQIRTMTRVFDQ